MTMLTTTSTIIHPACFAQHSEMRFPQTWSTIFVMRKCPCLSCESLSACHWFSWRFFHLILVENHSPLSHSGDQHHMILGFQRKEGRSAGDLESLLFLASLTRLSNCVYRLHMCDRTAGLSRWRVWNESLTVCYDGHRVPRSIRQGCLRACDAQERGNDEGAIASVCICLPPLKNVPTALWLELARCVVGRERDGVLSDGGRGESSMAVGCPVPSPFSDVSCGECHRSVGPVTRWALDRSWPPVGAVCALCGGCAIH